MLKAPFQDPDGMTYKPKVQNVSSRGILFISIGLSISFPEVKNKLPGA